MLTTWVWNLDFIVWKRKQEQLILKNDISGAMVALSQAEYQLLMAYVQENSLSFVRKSLADYDIREDNFQSIITKAKDLHLIEPFGKEHRHQRQNEVQIKLYYLGSKICGWLHKILRLDITPEFRGNLRLFQLFSLNLNGSCWQKMAKCKCWQKYFWLLLIACYLGLGLNLVFHPCADFAFSGFATTQVPAMGMFLLLIVSIVLCLFCHEMGHYFVYKSFHGEGDRIGFGTMFMVFPVLYTQIDDCTWWTKRQRVLLSLAGVAMDVLIVLLLSNFLAFYHHANLLALVGACLFFYYIVQIFTNLNPFFPGTDGYYLMEDLLNLHAYYGFSMHCLQKAWSDLRQLRFPSLNKKEWIAVTYSCAAAVCISVYWLLITSLLTFPLWSRIVLNAI